MRDSLVRFSLIVLTTLALVGCRSNESSVRAPTWSMSKLNPFRGKGSDGAYPPRPSSLSAPNVTPAPGADYAGATSGAPGQAEYANVAPGYRPSPDASAGAEYSYPPASSGALAGSAVSTNPAATPQGGYYDPGSAYGVAGQSGSTPSYASPGTADAPRYGVVADRYGLNRDASQASTVPGAGYGSAATYPTTPSYSSQGTISQGSPSGYEGGARPDYSLGPDSPYSRGSNVSGLSVADSRYDSGPSYGADARSLVGDRYAPVDTQAAGLDSYRSGQLGISPGDASWNPGQTGYVPGQSGYEPGNTGYQPPGITPYRSPAEPYSSSPFLPGSTRTYTPRSPDGSVMPQESLPDPQVRPQTDTQVIPAGNPPVWPTRTF